MLKQQREFVERHAVQSSSCRFVQLRLLSCNPQPASALTKSGELATRQMGLPATTDGRTSASARCVGDAGTVRPPNHSTHSSTTASASVSYPPTTGSGAQPVNTLKMTVCDGCGQRWDASRIAQHQMKCPKLLERRRQLQSHAAPQQPVPLDDQALPPPNRSLIDFSKAVRGPDGIPANGAAETDTEEKAACPHCGRSFAQSRISKHIEVCAKSGSSARPVYDAAALRRKEVEVQAGGTAPTAPTELKKPGGSQKGPLGKKASWREESARFQAAMRAARNEETNHFQFL